jgi:hypothetical protein
MQRGVELHGRTSSSASLGTETDGLSDAGLAAELPTATGGMAAVGGTFPGSGKAASHQTAAAGARALGEAVEGQCGVGETAQPAAAAAAAAGGAADAALALQASLSPGSEQQPQPPQQQRSQQFRHLLSSASLATGSSADWDLEEGSSTCGGPSLAAAPAAARAGLANGGPSAQHRSIAGIGSRHSGSWKLPQHSSAAVDGSMKGSRGAGIGAGVLRGDSSCCCGGCLGGEWGPSHVPKMEPLTASQRLTREAIVQVSKLPGRKLAC